VTKPKRYFKFKNGVDFGESIKMNDEGSLSIEENENDSIVVWIDAIHAMTTANYTTYTAKELKGSKENKTGVHSWTHPYSKPVLTHHNQHNGEPVGRVLRAEFKEKSIINGEPCNRLKVKLTDEKAIQKVKDGRYKTVSIGGRAEQAFCSICHQDLINEGMCEHWPGNEYDGETCHVILGDISFIEVSFVNVPADSNAMVINIVDDDPSSSSEGQKNQEGFNNKSPVKIINESKYNQGGNQMKDLQEKYDLLQEKYDTKEERVDVLETKLSNTKSKLETIEEKYSNLKEKYQVKEDKIENLEEEIQTLQEKNTKLKAVQHKQLAEDIVEMKIKMGRLTDKGEEFRDEMIEKHVQRSSESLKDTLEDLKIEQELKEESQEPTKRNKVQNPGKHNSQESQVKDEDGEKLVSEEIQEKMNKLNL